jgi:hypothetical protein
MYLYELSQFINFFGKTVILIGPYEARYLLADIVYSLLGYM